jgi:holo-[acyl-carrier protein] synthase
MKILGIGVDLLVTSRLECLIARRGADRLAKRILSPSEAEDFAICKDRIGYLASRFAIKEALFKAASTGQTRLQWKDVTVSKEAFGKPVAIIDPKYQMASHISISHDGGHLVAFAMVFK